MERAVYTEIRSIPAFGNINTSANHGNLQIVVLIQVFFFCSLILTLSQAQFCDKPVFVIQVHCCWWSYPTRSYHHCGWAMPVGSLVDELAAPGSVCTRGRCGRGCNHAPQWPLPVPVCGIVALTVLCLCTTCHC